MTPAQRRLLGLALGVLMAITNGLHPSTARAVYANGGNAIS